MLILVVKHSHEIVKSKENVFFVKCFTAELNDSATNLMSFKLVKYVKQQINFIK
jgi:hypothetical protein